MTSSQKKDETKPKASTKLTLIEKHQALEALANLAVDKGWSSAVVKDQHLKLKELLPYLSSRNKQWEEVTAE